MTLRLSSGGARLHATHHPTLLPSGTGLLSLTPCAARAAPTRTSTFNVQVGHCIQLPTEENVTDLATTDCSTLHDAEVFHLSQVTADERPTDTELEDIQLVGSMKGANK